MQNIVTVNSDGTGVVTLDDQPSHVTAGSVEEARRQLLGVVIDHARRVGRPVEVIARDAEAEHHLSVHPDGTVEPVRDAPRRLACSL